MEQGQTPMVGEKHLAPSRKNVGPKNSNEGEPGERHLRRPKDHTGGVKPEDVLRCFAEAAHQYEPNRPIEAGWTGRDRGMVNYFVRRLGMVGVSGVEVETCAPVS
jgi:hypothetical protein